MDPRDENRSSAPATPEETLKALEAMLPEPEQLTLDRAAVFDEDLAAKKARREKQQRPRRPRPPCRSGSAFRTRPSGRAWCSP